MLSRLADTLWRLENENDELLLSAASSWEIVIEHAHALGVGSLPAIHRDSLDRILIAQAQCEGPTLVTKDPNIRRYDVPVLVP